MTKHFLKTLIVFSVMIILGLVGVIVFNHLDKETNERATFNLGIAD